jgi:hypothetical protein
MRKIMVAAVAAFAVLVLAGMGSSAYALSVSVDIPVSGSTKFKDQATIGSKTLSGLSGYRVGVDFGLLGVGYEAYEGKVDLTDCCGAPDFKEKTTFTDVQINLPIPMINIAVGYGFGQIKDTCADTGNGACADKWDATQYYVTVGIPIRMFDVHVSYHSISGKATGSAKYDPATGSGAGDLENKVILAGVRVGW